jgi:ADP-ribosyl-[dinitrogen reductase] hydrolase
MMKAKIKGLVIGAAVGDALGVPFESRYSRDKYQYRGLIEYKGINFNRFRKPPYKYLAVGQISDDTEMMLIIFRSLVRNHFTYNEDDVIKNYLEWANDKYTCHMGINTRELFKGIKTVKGYRKRYQHKFSDKQLRYKCQSNGAMMRCAILALLPIETGLKDCLLTNPGIVTLDANKVYLTLVQQSIKQVAKQKIIENIVLLDVCPEVKEVVVSALSDYWDRDIESCKGWCLHSLYCAIFSFNNFDLFGSYSSVIDFIIGKGGDTDTNACIVGSLIGCYIGYDKMLQEDLTKRNISLVLACDTTSGDFPREKKWTLEGILEEIEEIEEIDDMLGDKNE